MSNRSNPFLIAQISDLHCGHPHFIPSLLDRAIVEINELEPDVVIVSGDLTGDGFRGEYELAREYLDKLACERMLVIPGNHDSRNVGYVHFEELFGERRSELHQDGVSILAVDSTEPDLDHGVIGRGRYEWIEERFGANEAYLRIFVLHHHLLPVPGTGRERNVVHDAGDTLECLQRADVHLVLSGHKHVPYAWRLEDLFVVNAGTVSTSRLRGKTKPCYNVIEASRGTGHRVPQVPVPRPRGAAQLRSQHVQVREAQRFARGDRPGVGRADAVVIALVDGEHHPAAVRDALDALERERGIAGVVFCGGEEKLPDRPLGELYGDRRVEEDREAGLRALAPSAEAVVDLADEPVLPARERLELAALALHLGLSYEAPGLRLDPPPYAPVEYDGPEARRDRHRQAHRQDGGRGALGRPAARPRPGDRLHGSWRAGRAARGRARHRARASCSRSSARAVTAPPTTSRTPCWPACARWGAAGSAAARPASRGSPTWSRAPPSPRRSSPA